MLQPPSADFTLSSFFHLSHVFLLLPPSLSFPPVTPLASPSGLPRRPPPRCRLMCSAAGLSHAPPRLRLTFQRCVRTALGHVELPYCCIQDEYFSILHHFSETTGFSGSDLRISETAWRIFSFLPDRIQNQSLNPIDDSDRSREEEKNLCLLRSGGIICTSGGQDGRV